MPTRTFARAGTRPESRSRRLEELIGSAFKILPFRQLPMPHQLAIGYYMAFDGEAWADACANPRARACKATLRSELPRIRERYGQTLFGILALSTRRLKCAVMQDPELAEDFPCWDSYHKWYLNAGPVPQHSSRSRWPVILSSFDDETLQDGWHRFHSYVRSGHRSIRLCSTLSAASCGQLT